MFNNRRNNVAMWKQTLSFSRIFLYARTLYRVGLRQHLLLANLLSFQNGMTTGKDLIQLKESMSIFTKKM